MAKKCPKCGGTSASYQIPFRGPDIIVCPCGNKWYPDEDKEADTLEDMATKAAFHARQAEKYITMMKRKVQGRE